MNTKNFVTVIEDGSDMYHSVDWDDNFNSWFKIIASDHIAKLGLKSSYGQEPKLVKVQVYELEIRDGQLHRKHCINFPIECPYGEMTDNEYQSEMAILLKDIPTEFVSFVESQAYRRGHSAGFDEMFLIASDIVEELKVAIKAYDEANCIGS